MKCIVFIPEFCEYTLKKTSGNVFHIFGLGFIFKKVLLSKISLELFHNCRFNVFHLQVVLVFSALCPETNKLTAMTALTAIGPSP